MIEIHEFARRMPKAELHVHLEGSIRPATLLELANRNHVHLPVQDEAGLLEFYRFRDFNHFVEVYFTITNCLKTFDDYALIAYEFGCECARQNTRYAEVTFTMTTNVKFSGLPWQEILTGLNQGRAQARQEFDIDWRWIFDINRNQPDTQVELVEIALAAREAGVVALGLGGSEAEFPAHLFLSSFERAKEGGLHRVPHAGETSGPDSIRDALNLLHAERIGHGVRASEDPMLVKTLRNRQVPLEICPTSNLRLGIYPNYADHPLRQLWEENVLITVNTDDPPMFGTDLLQEYTLLIDEFHFTYDELERISLNAVRSSFLSEPERNQLEETFIAEFQRLKNGTG